MKRILLALTLGLGLQSHTTMAENAHSEHTAELETITLGAGCFWCVEAVFQRLEGVESAVSGYMGGHVENPTYKAVCTGETGHAEVIQVKFDPSVISLDRLLEVFWVAHDPTTLNRQGGDVGTQYRSAIFYENDEQRKVAEASRARAEESGKYRNPIVTEVTAAETFYEAENYHQEFYELNKSYPYCQMVITPKLKKLGLE